MILSLKPNFSISSQRKPTNICLAWSGSFRCGVRHPQWNNTEKLLLPCEKTVLAPAEFFSFFNNWFSSCFSVQFSMETAGPVLVICTADSHFVLSIGLKPLDVDGV